MHTDVELMNWKGDILNIYVWRKHISENFSQDSRYYRHNLKLLTYHTYNILKLCKFVIDRLPIFTMHSAVVRSIYLFIWRDFWASEQLKSFVYVGREISYETYKMKLDDEVKHLPFLDRKHTSLEDVSTLITLILLNMCRKPENGWNYPLMRNKGHSS